MMKINKNRKKYNLNPAVVWGITAGLCAGVLVCAYILFLDIVISLTAAAVSILPIYSKVRKECSMSYEKKIRKEFVTCLVTLSGTLSSGGRIEQGINEIAVSESSEIRHIRPEFARMSKLIQLNLPVEKAFSEFADRVPLTDIKLFSQALEYGIPAGINLVELVRSFSSGMRIRNDTEAEIAKTLNMPKYNNRVIMAMPFIMIALMRLTAADYLANIDNGTGAIIKTVSSGLIIFAVVLGELLGDIEYA